MKKGKKWKELLNKWWGLEQEKVDTANAVDKPRDVAHYDSAVNSIPGPDHTYQGDLMHMDWLNPDKKAKRHHYALVCVDVYSTRVYILPVRRKDAGTMCTALSRFFERIVSGEPLGEQKVRRFQTDLGTEFFNKDADRVYERWNIRHYHTHSMQKAYLAENKIKQIKTYYNEMRRSGQLERVIRSEGKSRSNSLSNDDWTSIVGFVEQRLNDKVHSRTGFTPLQMDVPVSENSVRHFIIRARLNRKLQLTKRRADRVHPFSKFKNRKELTRGLRAGTKVYVTKGRKRGVTTASPFLKPSTSGSLWDKSVVYKVGKRFERYKDDASPSFLYSLINPLTGKTLRPKFYREELHVLNDQRNKNAYGSKSEYTKDYLRKWAQQGVA